MIAKPMVRPLTILLTCCSSAFDSCNIRIPTKYDGIEDDITWVLNGEEKMLDMSDTILTRTLWWSFNSLIAEVCLHLAKRLDSGDDRQYALVEEGLRLSGLAEAKIKDNEGNVTNDVSFESINRIHSELRNFNDSNV